MMRHLHPDLRLALRQLRVEGLVARLGERSRVAKTPAELPFAARELLYEAFYLRPRPRPAPTARGSRGAFVEALVAANRSPHGYEDGFAAVGHWRGQLLVRRGGLTLHAPPDALLAAGLLRVPPVQRAMLPGFLLLLGSTPAPDAPGCRVYWNLRPERAVAWVGKLTEVLEAERVPFRMKVLQDPAAFWRVDAGVLYLRRCDQERALPLLLPLAPALNLRHATPRFTRQLGAGLALADDPPGGESFGEHRCRLVVEAALAAPRRPGPALVQRLLAAGIDPAEPWRGP